jgi:SpoIIAA-like
MHFRIELAQGYLRAELADRKTAADTQEFIKALSAKALEGGCARVLISVRNSRPIFKLQPYGIIEYFRHMAANPATRVALISDSDEMRSSQQYIAMLGREQGAKVQAFSDEAAALEWLRGQSQEKR